MLKSLKRSFLETHILLQVRPQSMYCSKKFVCFLCHYICCDQTLSNQSLNKSSKLTDEKSLADLNRNLQRVEKQLRDLAIIAFKNESGAHRSYSIPPSKSLSPSQILSLFLKMKRSAPYRSWKKIAQI